MTLDVIVRLDGEPVTGVDDLIRSAQCRSRPTQAHLRCAAAGPSCGTSTSPPTERVASAARKALDQFRLPGRACRAASDVKTRSRARRSRLNARIQAHHGRISSRRWLCCFARAPGLARDYPSKPVKLRSRSRPAGRPTSSLQSSARKLSGRWKRVRWSRTVAAPAAISRRPAARRIPTATHSGHHLGLRDQPNVQNAGYTSDDFRAAVVVATIQPIIGAPELQGEQPQGRRSNSPRPKR